MGIRCNTDIDRNENKPFPKIMISKLDGEIVLFYTEREGISLKSPDKKNGTLKTKWNMSKFVDYNIPVTIQNI